MRMRSGLWTLAAWCSLQAFACAAESAVFVLATGGKLEGQLLNPDERPRETFVVRTSHGGQMTLLKQQVERVEQKSESLQWYEAARLKVPHTVEGHWEMAEECRERGLRSQREFHLQRILDIDPDHEKARALLDYVKAGGRWMRPDELMASRGYVRYRGEWRIPQEVSLEQRAEQAAKQAREWRQKVKMWCANVIKGRGNEEASRENLRDIRDPLAAAALAEVVNDQNSPVALRRLCLDVLARLQTQVAVGTFIDRALRDGDENIREACLHELARFGTAQAVKRFEGLLRSGDNPLINRAARCLGSLQATESTLPLINVLVTEHKSLVQVGGNPGQMSLSFGSGAGGGGNSFSAGGSTKLIKQSMQNEQVLNALHALHPGVDFGYDVDRWKRWYSEQTAPQVTSLRREE